MRLTSAEFERRYEQYPNMRAELIEGEVYVASPMKDESHGEPTFELSGWLAVYRASNVAVTGGEGSSLRLDDDNRVQPDTFLRYREGRSRRTADGYLEGAPELVCEVAASSAGIDMGRKKRAYERNGVLEYIVWQVYENRIDWFWLNADGAYERLEPDARGVIESRVFPGLRLAVDKMLARDLAGVLAEQNRKVRQRKGKAGLAGC